MAGTICRIGKTNIWAASIDLDSVDAAHVETPSRASAISPMAIHYVIDNSASMGNLTRLVTEEFSSLVDSASSKPCSLTIFDRAAKLLSDRIESSQQMLSLNEKYSQGATNIPAGVQCAMNVVRQTERAEGTSRADQKTHHILLLLTDGMHNTGPQPSTAFPKIGNEMKKSFPNVKLSVVVVGITRDSDTSMGMNLKTSIETVPLDDTMKNIYFAIDRQSIKSVIDELIDGLNRWSMGRVYNISSPSRSLISTIGDDLTTSISIRRMPKDTRVSMLLEGEAPLDHMIVDREKVKLVQKDGTDMELIADILRAHMDKIRVMRVATNVSSTVRLAISQLNVLIDALEAELKRKGMVKLMLRQSHAAERLSQNRNITKAVHLARELRNEIAEISNFTANNSAEQAAFLTGRQSRYAKKAMRRAAARTNNEMVLDPQKELARVRDEIKSQSFAASLRSLLRIDAITHLSRLSKEQQSKLLEAIKAKSMPDFSKVDDLMSMNFAERLHREDEVVPSPQLEGEKKVHTSALCWIPPKGDVYEAIQRIRKKHDRQIKRWPPHINLLYPFVPFDDFEDAAKKLAEGLRTVAAFPVRLCDVRHFKHSSRSFTAWLHPDETNEFVSLQALCQAMFPHCDDLTSSGPFVPHLTVGQCKSQKSVEALADDAKWQPSVTQCGEICLISRSAEDAPFVVHFRIQLGARAFTTMPPMSSLDDMSISSLPSPMLSCKQDDPDLLEGLDPTVVEFVDSGALSGYLNEVFFGERRSYLSLSSQWEHIAEWMELSRNNVEFESLWEMLLYAGSLAYPITVHRSDGTQMNPFQLSVTKINTTIIDTASLCCANHSEIDTYGPEGGEPIRDALVLVDPSCPKASTKITKSALLGETYTSVVLSRDLHMYTGASMKVALLAKSLFRSLLPTTETKSNADVVAELRRVYMNRAFQCSSCGFGPVDHGGCSDLFAHHGEVDDEGGVASNACPVCEWFSEDLADWEPWDGTVHETLLADKMEDEESTEMIAIKPLASMVDMALRITYTFRKTFENWYTDLAHRLIDWDLRFSTQDEVDSLVQILIAIMACGNDVIGDKKTIEDVFAPPVILAMVNEACARSARKKLRMMANGKEGEAKELAADLVTKMLSISAESAPTTTASLLEPEPDRAMVEEVCCREYKIDPTYAEEKSAWVMNVANKWCRALELARALRVSLIKRGGGWARLERDMETSLDDYADVVREIQDAPIRTFWEMCDIAESEIERTRTLITMAAQAMLHNKGALRRDLPDVRDGETLRDISKDMRMRIYSIRVQEKMSQWTDVGEQLTFAKARAADIGQYSQMALANRHVHGLNREMFWGLWDAAVYDGSGGEKVLAFIETANEPFCIKYASGGGGQVRGRQKKKKKKK